MVQHMIDTESLATFLQQIEKTKQESIKAGIPALVRLHEAARVGSGQSHVIRLLLIGIYNGEDHPFDLNSLRGLDETLFSDVIGVIRFDRYVEKETHLYLPADAQKEIAQWAWWKCPSS